MLKSWNKFNFCNEFSGEPVVCQQGSASLNMANCLLAERGIDYSVLHLNDPACKGQMEEQTHMVTFEFNSNTCGALVMVGALIIEMNETNCWIQIFDHRPPCDCVSGKWKRDSLQEHHHDTE